MRLISMLLILAGPAIVVAQPKTEKILPPVVTPAKTKAIKGIEFAKVGDRSLQMDLYLPEKAARPMPTIVWVHGGAWRHGSRDKFPVRALTQVPRGYAVASISYRFSNEEVFPAQIVDCRSAIRWLRANADKYGLDPDRIGVWGASAGGHLASLLGTAHHVKEWDKGDNLDRSSRVQAVVNMFGPTDFLRMESPENPYKASSPRSAESELIGGPIEEHRDKVAKASPITYVTKDAAPFLFVFGEKDIGVAPKQAQFLLEPLKKTGVEATLIVVPGAGHGGPLYDAPEVIERINAFFDRHLKR